MAGALSAMDPDEEAGPRSHLTTGASERQLIPQLLRESQPGAERDPLRAEGRLWGR